MAERPNHPIDKVRKLQRGLFIAAKRSPERRFHALFDRIARVTSWWAWKRVKGNGGAAGVDRNPEGDRAARSWEFLRDLQRRLKTGTDQPVRRRHIPKADGKRRPLGIPTVRDRVAQMAAKLVIRPI
jgi:RNA-directed DNA polymerase